MHVISKKKLQEFWNLQSKAKSPLEAWYQVAKHAEWKSFAELRKAFPAADLVGKFVVFDIGGNKYRLVAAIHFNRGKLYVRQCSRMPNMTREDGRTIEHVGQPS